MKISILDPSYFLVFLSTLFTGILSIEIPEKETHTSECKNGTER